MYYIRVIVFESNGFSWERIFLKDIFLEKCCYLNRGIDIIW